jgi:tryptophan synthase alpha chain
MNRIDARFEALRKRGETAFIPYVTAGDPSLDATAALVLELEKAGSDIIEFGIPFSDPIADGKANQEAAQRALLNGVTLHDVVALVKQLRDKTQIPILLFTYYNPVLAYGVEALAADARDAGVDGILCVDLPPEEAGDYKRCMDAAGIATVFLIAPTSTDERVRLIAGQSTGFIYYVSRTGVTGVRQDLESATGGMVERIRAHSDKPVCVGFGISTPDQAREVAGYADGVIVGSAIVGMVGELGDRPDMPARVGAFVRSLVEAAKGH